MLCAKSAAHENPVALVALLASGVAHADSLKITDPSHGQAQPLLNYSNARTKSPLMNGYVDLGHLRTLLGGRRIAVEPTAIRMVSQYHTDAGWQDRVTSWPQVTRGPRTVDFNKVKLGRIEFTGNGALTPMSDNELNNVRAEGIASRLEVKLEDGSTETIEMQNFGENAKLIRNTSRY